MVEKIRFIFIFADQALQAAFNNAGGDNNPAGIFRKEDGVVETQFLLSMILNSVVLPLVQLVGRLLKKLKGKLHDIEGQGWGWLSHSFTVHGVFFPRILQDLLSFLFIV
ncbi:MAG: hypothetical protein ABFS19_13200 [Thermodesulfobacteriota bacterium]